MDRFQGPSYLANEPKLTCPPHTTWGVAKGSPKSGKAWDRASKAHYRLF